MKDEPIADWIEQADAAQRQQLINELREKRRMNWIDFGLIIIGAGLLLSQM